VVRGTDVALRRDVALLRRHAPEAHGARRVARRSVAAVVHNSHIELRFLVAAERGTAPVRDAACFVEAQAAKPVEEEAAHFKLAPNVPLRRGLAKPARGLGRRRYKSTLAALVHNAKIVMRVRVAHVGCVRE
jgi:hypothetical protein